MVQRSRSARGQTAWPSASNRRRAIASQRAAAAGARPSGVSFASKTRSDAAASCSTRSVLARSQKSLVRPSVAKLTLGRWPSEKALGSHGISSEASLCNSGSRLKNLPPLALERTSPNYVWLVILFCFRLKKGWSEHAKLLEPRRLRRAHQHKVDWPSLRGGGLGSRLPGHRVEI